MRQVRGHQRRLSNGRTVHVRQHERRGDSPARTALAWIAPRVSRVARRCWDAISAAANWTAATSARLVVSGVDRTHRAWLTWRAERVQAKEEARLAQEAKEARQPTVGHVNTPAGTYSAAHRQAEIDLARAASTEQEEREREEMRREVSCADRQLTEQPISEREIRSLLDRLQRPRQATRAKQQANANKIHRTQRRATGT